MTWINALASVFHDYLLVMDNLILIAVIVIVYVLGSPLYLLRRQRRHERDMEKVSRKLESAITELQRVSQQLKISPETEPETDQTRSEEEDTREVEPALVGQEPDEETEIQPPVLVGAEPPATVTEGGPWDARTQPDAPKPTTKPSRGVEETLASKWLIWIGAIAVGLSAVFLFRYAVDQGWLTPLTRVLLGLILGGLLLAAGEWTMRNPVKAVRRAVNPDYVPPALTGSGIFAIFVSSYAAHAMFGLLTAGTAFVVLGLVAYSALVLSLRQGPFVALLGFLAGYLVPALIEMPVTQSAPLFVYLFVLSAGCLLVMVWRKWWWFSYLTLVGAFLWPILYLLESWTMSDQGVLDAYALGLAVLFALLSTGLPIKRPQIPLWRWLIEMLADTSGLGFTLSGLLLLLLANAAEFNAAAFYFIGFYCASALLMASRRAALESLIIVAAAISLTAVLFWPEPASVTPALGAQTLPEPGFGPFSVPPEYSVYSVALWGLAVLFGGGGFIGSQRGRTPVVWTGVSTLMPLLFFCIGYWRVGKLETDISWAAVAAGLAVLFSAVAVAKARQTRDGRSDLMVAFYAAGATAAIALAFSCLLREAWLTVALSSETLALAWIWSRTQLSELRSIAMAVTIVVIVRLVANQEILEYQGDFLKIFGWVIYGYGIPAVANLLAARIFARSRVDAAATTCEIAGVGFAFLMVALQLKLWTSGGIYTPSWLWRLFDQSVQTLWWIAAAGLLLFEARRSGRKWPYPAGLGLLAISVVVVFLSHVFTLSPLLTNESVGYFPLMNLLGLAYFLPAVLFFFIGHSNRFKLANNLRSLFQGAAGVLIFIYISLETRRAFWGTNIGLSGSTEPTNGELYAYSAVWIVFALCLLFIGIVRVSVPLRYASLAVLMVTVAKVFLLDMSDLSGLFRVASFLGLGLTLIGIGRVYQRFVFRPVVSDQASDSD
ncbi:DUF2339 domain-containing protein [Pseudohalocynthiibacter aestuariivivens]|uniref:DUF2339 domain-containing protein n=1 Tax=Pseudohalocynthiibacter aestuariivivens TaxID=1591409 RepID=A0ABV5JK78_9RHOB|nr:DUF2339 domain-containing protein [Pseudohalocynthiibacter aestuariivivens]MBS9715569.1 DUF2339 domain-containing protein [Pseudohalocynthiibacter aestuariivivens]